MNKTTNQIANDIVEDIYKEKGKDMVHGTLDLKGILEHINMLGHSESDAQEIAGLVMAITESS